MFKKTITINDVMNTLTEERETMLSKYKNILENQSDPVKDKLIEYGFRGLPCIQECGESYYDKRYIEELFNFYTNYVKNYPNYIFYTGKVIENTCKKLGLYFGHINLYIKDIPEKNQADIVNFKINETDYYYDLRLYDSKRSIVPNLIDSNSSADFNLVQETKNRMVGTGIEVQYRPKYNFFILAPRNYFRKDCKMVFGYKLERLGYRCNDPVIFFECIGGFLKVTEFEI